MDRIDKLTNIYINNIDPINGEKLSKRTLRDCLLDILDTSTPDLKSNSNSSSVNGVRTFKKKYSTSATEKSMSKWNNTLTSDSSISKQYNTKTLKLGQYPQVLKYILQVFEYKKSNELKEDFISFSHSTDEMNGLLLMERRIGTQIITMLLGKIDMMKSENKVLERKTEVYNSQINEFKAHCQALRPQVNSQTRYNTKMEFNSFVSDLTDIPLKVKNPHVNLKETQRDCSINSMKTPLVELSNSDFTASINIDNKRWEIT